MKSITRRTAVSGVAANMALLSTQTAFGSQANSAVSFGIIGTGNRGVYVGKYMAEDPRTRLVAVCDIFPEKIDRAKTEIPAADKAQSYRDYKELLARQDIDAVLIATPAFLHPEHFEAAVAAGKHIYCEKPAGADVAGVKRLLAAAGKLEGSKSVVFGFQQRFSPEYLAAEKMLREGKAGELTLMIAFWMAGGEAFRPRNVPANPTYEEKIRFWYSYKETSGDFIVEQDCHGVDVLNWYAQAHPVSAVGDGGRARRKWGTCSDHANISYRYPGGLKGWLLGSQLPTRGYGDVREQFFGTMGVLETARRYYSFRAAGSSSPERVESKREITIDAVEHFYTSILEGKPIRMAQDAADSTLTALLGRMAMETGKEVTWEELLRPA